MAVYLLPWIPSGTLAQEKSVLEKDPDGWIDLFPSPDLQHWKRVALDQGLAEKNPWNVRDDVLVYNGTGAKEMFLYDKPFSDHTWFRIVVFRSAKETTLLRSKRRQSTAWKCKASAIER